MCGEAGCFPDRTTQTMPELLAAHALGLTLAVLVPLGLVRLACYLAGEPLYQLLLRRIAQSYCVLMHNLRANRRPPIPGEGAALLVANHVCNLDPVFLQCTTRHRVISFFMAAEYLRFWIFKPIYTITQVIPVTRTGRDTGPALAGLRALREGRVLGIFPEGGIKLTHDQIGPARPGAAYLALRSRATVVPAFIDRELHTHSLVEAITTRSRTRVYYGRPLDLSRYYGKRITDELLHEVADVIMDAIGSLSPRPIKVLHCREVGVARPVYATEPAEGARSP